ncbi:Galectin-3 [Oryzias melastigma]|uniref:Galectin n=1 Tax=Oryzias melastigma TaxID=30732 RepID=A0A834CAW5_ORYME|nr:Galectin-3 [Oryzias melastigma]
MWRLPPPPRARRAAALGPACRHPDPAFRRGRRSRRSPPSGPLLERPAERALLASNAGPSHFCDPFSSKFSSGSGRKHRRPLWPRPPTPAPALAVQPSCQPCWPGVQYQPAPPPSGVQYQPAPPPPAPTIQYQRPRPLQLPASIPPSPAGPLTPDGPTTRDSQAGPDKPPRSCLSTGSPPHLVLCVPYNLNLARGVYDKMMMTILGYVKPNAKMFTVNFLRGNDIAFHINPRFNEGGKQVVVRNHKLGERWGQEERDLKGPFPFASGSTFEMKVLCTPEAFRVAVNNIPMFEFRHRIRELNQIDRINILHDVVLTYINVETLP